MAEATVVRWLIVRDLPDVLRIEKAVFRSPWDRPKFMDVLGGRNVIGMVAEASSGIRGFMIYELRRKPDEVRLLSFVVDPAMQRKGIGKQMVRRLADKLEMLERHAIRVLLPESNLEGHLFAKAVGFRAVSVCAGNCDDGLDSYEFEYVLPSRSKVSVDMEGDLGELLEVGL